MKNLIVIITTVMILSSCVTSKEAGSTKSDLKIEKKLAEQAVIKNAVESKRYIVKFDRLYLSHGGILDLVPKANYIVIDGEKAIISAAYMGRQFSIRPIAGINTRGNAMDYEVTFNPTKGIYDIKMKVRSQNNSFDVYLTIGKNGSCDASINNSRIDNIRYSGRLVPIKDKSTNSNQNNILI